MNTDQTPDTHFLDLEIHAQPNDETCGPTSLHAVYQYYNDYIPLKQVIRQVKQLKSGGTLAVMLGNHALERGYKATLFTYNLQMFDPTWFRGKVVLEEKLREQLIFKATRKFKVATEAYLKFIELGGEIRFEELSAKLIRNILKDHTPILTGLSATYLYDCSREIPETNEYHDVQGQPTGHFVVIKGYDPVDGLVHIADPLETNPISDTQHYKVKIQRLINAILLGIVTYDANLLIIKPE